MLDWDFSAPPIRGLLDYGVHWSVRKSLFRNKELMFSYELLFYLYKKCHFCLLSLLIQERKHSVDPEEPLWNVPLEGRPFLQILESGFQVNHSKCTLPAVFFYEIFKTGSKKAKTDSIIMSCLCYLTHLVISWEWNKSPRKYILLFLTILNDKWSQIR